MKCGEGIKEYIKVNNSILAKTTKRKLNTKPNDKTRYYG